MLTGPDLSASKPKRMWRIGEYRAFLFERPRPIAEAAGLPVWIEYRWALAVFGNSRPTDPLTIVTAEIAMPSSGADEQVGRDEATCLCQFMPDGIHANLGNSPDWANEERFISAALDIARRFANTESAPVEIKIHGYRRAIVTSVAFASIILLAALFQHQATNEPPGFGIADWLYLTFILYIATGTAVLALTRAGHVVATTVADIHFDASRSVKPIASWKLRFASFWYSGRAPYCSGLYSCRRGRMIQPRDETTYPNGPQAIGIHHDCAQSLLCEQCEAVAGCVLCIFNHVR